MFRLAVIWIAQWVLAASAFAAGFLENPQPGSTQSGIALVSGWNCSATQITVRIDGASAISVPYGSPRGDTLAVCGHVNTGFALLINFNVLGPGNHTISALADGVEFQSATFNVVTLGQEFLSGAAATGQISGFPDSAHEVTVQWQESKQNFSITGVSPVGTTGALDGTYRLVRATVDYIGGQLLDTSVGNIAVTGTMVIAGNKATQNVTVTVLGQTQSVSSTITFTDLGAYFQWMQGTTTNRFVIVQRSPLLITERALSALGSSFSEVDQWVRIGKSASANLDSPAPAQTAPEKFGAGVAAALH